MDIKSKDIIALTQCLRKYELNKLSLKNGNDRYKLFREGIYMMNKALYERISSQEIGQRINAHFLDSYKEAWFPLSWQKKKAVENDVNLFMRFLTYFESTASKIISVNKGFKIHLPFTCNEVNVQNVYGMADIIIEDIKNNRMEAMIISRKFPKPYSYQARKNENKVLNSIELIAIMEWMKKEYAGKDIVVSLVRLCAASDKPGVLVPFENKRGDNIVSFSNKEYDDKYPDGIDSAIQEVVDQYELCACKDCVYEGLCAPANKIKLSCNEEKKEVRPAINFSREQMKVICHKDGPIRVSAGPGSGKTAVLVGRIEALIASGVRPDSILGITFTKKAALEMSGRIHGENKPVIGTLHSLAFELLIKNTFIVGLLRLAGKVDCMKLLLVVLEHAPIIQGVSYEGLTMQYGLIPRLLKDFDFINRHGEEGFQKAYPKKDLSGILAVKRMYDEAFVKSGCITFDEQITRAVQLMKEYPGVQAAVQDKFRYIMVDEVQDIDPAQAEFIQLLVNPKHKNLMICGDADQSIYAFRGGNNQFMLDFVDIYPGAVDVRLQDNYRSSEEIVSTSVNLIKNNKNRIPMVLRASFKAGCWPILIQHFNRSRLHILIDDIIRKGYRYKDIAVIATTNSMLQKLCDGVDEETRNTGIHLPVERPKLYLRDDYIFNLILDLLELKVKGMHQDAALYRLLKEMGCDINKEDKTKSLYDDHITRHLIPAFEGEEASRYWIESDDRLQSAYGSIYRALSYLDTPLEQALDEISHDVFPQTLCWQEVMEIIADLIYERRIKTYTELYELLFAIKLFQDDTRIQYESGDMDKVHMLTAHDAKGKEFPVVIIFGIEKFEREDVEEDRRLLYVALTRAKRALFLIEDEEGRSEYLKEIKDYLTIERRNRYE